MLNLSLAEVARGEVRVRGTIAPDDPLWEGTRVALREPLEVDLDARSVGEGVLVRGTIRAGKAVVLGKEEREVASVG